MRVAPFFILCVLTAAAPPLRAAAGDAAAVEQFCGAPSSEQQGVSQVTNRMERSLTYGTMILHFEPAANGWTFLSGWYDHLPMTEKMVEGRMPCFAQAMAASREQQPEGAPAYEDPAIRQQTAAPVADTTSFGIPHLWLILLLTLILVLMIVIPGSRRRKLRQTSDVETLRYRRKPVMARFFRRKPGAGVDV